MFYITWMIYIIHVYVSKQSQIVAINYPLVGHSEFYLVPINVNLYDVMI